MPYRLVSIFFFDNIFKSQLLLDVDKNYKTFWQEKLNLRMSILKYIKSLLIIKHLRSLKSRKKYSFNKSKQLVV